MLIPLHCRLNWVMAGLLLAAGPALWAQQYVISTFAGVPVTPRSTPAVAASIGPASRLALDNSGNLYFSVNSGTAGMVFKIDSGGALWHVVGLQRGGRVVDGVPAAFAALSGGTGGATGGLTDGNLAIAVDAKGNLYIADTNHHRIRRVSPDGAITTVAGTGAQGDGGDGGPATRAQLKFPSGVAVDSAGNIYIGDSLNDRIRKVSPDGTITTIAGGNPTTTDPFSDQGDNRPAANAFLDFPTGLAVDNAGNIYVADTFDNRIRKISADGIITTVAGSGPFGWNFSYDPAYPGDGTPANKMFLSLPVSVAVDNAGNVYFQDNGGWLLPVGCIRKVSPSGILSTVAGNGSAGYSGDGGLATNAKIGFAKGLAVGPQGEVYIADTSNNRIRKVSPAGTINTIAGNGGAEWWSDWAGSYSGDYGPAAEAGLSLPSALAFDGSGSLYIADSGNHRVRKVAPGGLITTAAGNGKAGFSGDGARALDASLNWPSGVTVDNSGVLFIADSFNYRVRSVSPAGTIATVIGNGSADFPFSIVPHIFLGLDSNLLGLYQPGGLATDASGTLYITDTYDAPAVDPLTGTVFFTDSQNSQVWVIDRDPAFYSYVTILENGKPGSSANDGPAKSAPLAAPDGVVVDPRGNLFVADCAANRILRASPDGTITTIAGDGTWGHAGDGGPATSAQVPCPAGLALDAAGNLYVAEPFTGTVRVLRPVTEGTLPSAPGDETAVYSSFPPGGETSTASAARVGGGSLAGNEGTILGEQFRLQLAAGAAVTLTHVEIVASRVSGSDILYGDLMTDDGGPGTLIERLTFRYLPSSFGLVSASSAAHPVLRGDRLYWFVLTPPDPVHDIFWWCRGTTGLSFSMEAQRTGTSGPWNVKLTWDGSALRVYGAAVPASMAAPVITGVVNAASGQAAIASGSLVSIYGTNLAPVAYADWNQSIVNGRLPVELGGVSVTIGSRAASIAAVTPTQINVQAPDFGVAQGITYATGATSMLSVFVTAPGGTSAPFMATSRLCVPAFFLWPGNQAVATHADYTWAARNGTFPGSATVPAKPGEIVTLWGTGFGPTDPAVPSGYMPTVAAPPLHFPVGVTLGGTGVPVVGAALSADSGLYQIAIQIPASTPDGDYALAAVVNGAGSPSGVIVSVRR